MLIDPSQVFNKLHNESEYYDLVTDTTIELKKNNILSEIKNNFTSDIKMKMVGPTVPGTIEQKKNNILSEIKNNFTSDIKMKMVGPTVTVPVTNSLELADRRSPKCADVRTRRGKQRTYR